MAVNQWRTTSCCINPLRVNAAGMATAQAPIQSAAARRRSIRPIYLPAGTVEVRCGLVGHFGSLIAIVLEKVVLVRTARPRTTDDTAVIEQLAGWFAAQEFHVIRLKAWRPRARTLSVIGKQSVVRACIIHWSRLHFAELQARLPREPAPNVIVPDSIRACWRLGAQFWGDSLALCHGLQATDPDFLIESSPIMVSVARGWEYRMSRWGARARTEGWFEVDDADLIANCDHPMRDCLRFVANYKLLPQTVARLL